MFNDEDNEVFTPFDVYYDPKSHRFLAIVQNHDDGVLCTGFAGFYRDAMTNTNRQLLSFEYAKDFIKVGAIDQFPQAERDSLIDSWKVKGF